MVKGLGVMKGYDGGYGSDGNARPVKPDVAKIENVEKPLFYRNNLRYLIYVGMLLRRIIYFPYRRNGFLHDGYVDIKTKEEQKQGRRWRQV